MATPKNDPCPVPWKTVVLGLRKTADAYLTSFATKKRAVGIWVPQVMAKIRYAKRPRKVELFLVSGEELGLTAVYSFEELRATMKAKGYRKCPPEVGPALFDQYDDQPVGEWVRVFMEPVLDSDSDLLTLDVARWSDGTYFNTHDANPERRFVPGTRWVVLGPAVSV